MNVEAKKLELMQLLLNTTKESLLLKIKKVFDEETDWYKELSVEEKEAIEVGIQQAKEGKVVSNESVMDNFKKWH